MRLGNPCGFCSVCFAASPEKKYVDCEADYDGAPVLDRETSTIAVLPWTGDLGGHDQLGICESCIREMAELIAFKPERNQRQLQEIRRLEIENEHLRLTLRRLKGELDTQLESAFGPTEIPRGRKVAA